MKRLAAFLLLAGTSQIPLWAGDYFTRQSVFSSSNSDEAIVKVSEIKAPSKKEVAKTTPAKKTETTIAATKATKFVPRVEPTKGIVQASGVSSTPPAPTTYMKLLFSTDSTAAVSVGQPTGPNIAAVPLTGVSVYAVPPKPPVEAPMVVTTKPTKKSATVAPAVPPTNFLSAGPLPTRPMIPMPTPTSMSLPPDTIIRPVEATTAVAPTSPEARKLSPMRQPEYVPPTPVHHAAAQAAMPLPTGFKLVGGELPGPYSGPVVAPAAPAAMSGPYAGPTASGCCPTCGANPRESGGIFTGRLRSWMFYQPTTRDALPRCQPLPYVGPIIAFRCDGGAGCGAGGYGGGCGTGNCATGNCATGNCAGAGPGLAGRFGGGDRGCKSGCVPPSDDVFPGYRFATGPSPMAGVGPYQTVNSSTSYKPAAPAPAAPPVADGSAKYYKPMYTPDSGVRPASGDVLARPFTRP
ncbi:MAG: hypothetical protein K8U57_22650 [Planctomycetes bacterium]|nr:hypothetical protein [Planctomycetota bacterium]